MASSYIDTNDAQRPIYRLTAIMDMSCCNFSNIIEKVVPYYFDLDSLKVYCDEIFPYILLLKIFLFGIPQ